MCHRNILLLLVLLQLFNSLFFRTTWASWYQKDKTSLELTEARDDGVWGWQWHQLDHMQTICTSLQTDNHTNTSSVNVYSPDALPAAQPTASKHWRQQHRHTHNRLMAICPDYPGRPVAEETFTHSHPSWSSDILYQLPPSTAIYSILCLHFTCLTVLYDNLSTGPLWSSPWSWTLYFILHAFLHPVIIFSSQHMPIPTQPVLL